MDGQENFSEEMTFHLDLYNEKELAMISLKKYHSRQMEQQIPRHRGNVILRRVKRKIETEETA